MKNRRNYYRILHVQPDAPAAVIKSSYTALMLKLGHHPDLGGTHDASVLLNEAYAVLSDPEKRRAYDRTLRPPLRPSARREDSSPGNHSPASPAARTTSSTSRSRACLFCESPVSGAGGRCPRCGSPTLPPPAPVAGGDTRTAPRVERHGHATLTTRDEKISRVILNDLSPRGLSVIAPEAYTPSQVVKVEGATLTAVARVVSCRSYSGPLGRGFLVGLAIHTVEFAASTGVLISTRA